MREIIAGRPAVRARRDAPTDEALTLFADQPYKREIIERRRRGADDADGGEVGDGDT